MRAVAENTVDYLRSKSAQLMTDDITLHRGELARVFDPNTGQEVITAPPQVWTGTGRVVQAGETEAVDVEGWNPEIGVAVIFNWDVPVRVGDYAHIETSKDPQVVDSWWELRAVRRDSWTVRRRCLANPVDQDIQEV
ncbi:MAG: hypothetical protein GEU73_07630 [Chloroflexi bacterium]|nr:hypothetical protein [Chloroflexota bacterium]